MALWKDIPVTSRPTFRYELNSTWLYGVMTGILALAAVFARKALGASRIEVALITAAAPSGMLFAAFWGHLSSSRRKMPFLVIPGLLGRGLITAIAFVSNSVWFTGIILLSFLISQLVLPVQAAVYQANYPIEFRGRIIGKVRAALFLTSAVVAFLAGRLLDRNPEYYRYLFPVAGLFGCVSIIIFARIRIRREKQTLSETDRRQTFWGSLGLLFSDRRFGLYEAFFSLYGMASHLMRPVLILFLTDVIGVDYTQSATALEFIPRICMVAAALFLGGFVDMHNPMIARSAFNFLSLLVPAIYFFSHSIAPIYLAKAIEGVALGGSGIVWVIGALYFADEKTAPTYQGIHVTLTGIRGVAGPFVGIFLLHLIGMRGVFIVAFCMQLIAALAMFRLGWAERRR